MQNLTRMCFSTSIVLFFVLIKQLPNINHQNRKYISHGMYEVGYETTICAGPVLSYSNRASWL